MMSLQVAKGFGYRSTLHNGGRGLTIVIFAAKKGRGQKIPTTAWVFQGLLADIVDALAGKCGRRISISLLFLNWLHTGFAVSCHIGGVIQSSQQGP